MSKKKKAKAPAVQQLEDISMLPVEPDLVGIQFFGILSSVEPYSDFILSQCITCY